MNTELRKNTQNEFEKNLFKLMKNNFFKTMENVRNHSEIKLVTSDKRRKILVSEPNYHSHKKFSEYLMATEMKKTRLKMIKPLYLGMSILDISKTLMYNFGMTILGQSMETRKNCSIQILIALLFTLKPKIFFEDISNDIERWFDTSNYNKNDKRSLPIGKNKKAPALLKMN